MDFRKDFDIVPRDNLWKILEDLNIPFELRVVAIRLYENSISNFKNNAGWSEDINCNIGFKKGFPPSNTLFGIYNDKLEVV